MAAASSDCVPAVETCVLAGQPPPSYRLQIALAPGLAAFLILFVWAMQPAGGAVDLFGWRPLSIHPAVWVSLVTGFCAYLVSVWIWVLKPSSGATRLFALSGVTTLLFTFADAQNFMARPVAPWLDDGLDVVNMLGASGFGIVMTWLFLIYPGPLPHRRWLAAAVGGVFGVWTLARAFGPFRDLSAVQPITFAEMICIVLAGLWQIWEARADPRRRAIAIWLGACVVLGAGIFIATISVPMTLGFEPLTIPQYAFASFLLIYAGLAVGLVRYRLFELGAWAFQLIFNAIAAIVVLVVDALLMASLSLAPGAAFGLALFAIAFVYMPMRDLAWRRVMRSRTPDNASVFRAVVGVALKPNGAERTESWRALFHDLYRPLEITAGETTAAPEIAEDGLELRLPAAADSPPLVIRYPYGGRALFGLRDLALAEQILALMIHTEESRSAYDRGVVAERTRMAQDIHDNIGAQLLRALHSGPSERKDAMIRDTLADLRDVINNAQAPDLPLYVVLADVRAETADRLEAHGIVLEWRVEAEDDLVLRTPIVHALRALVREATSNAIKHAGAQGLRVTIARSGDLIGLRIEDDGRGFSLGRVRLGHGLANMKARAEALGGSFALDSNERGSTLTVTLPLFSQATPQ